MKAMSNAEQLKIYSEKLQPERVALIRTEMEKLISSPCREAVVKFIKDYENLPLEIWLDKRVYNLSYGQDYEDPLRATTDDRMIADIGLPVGEMAEILWLNSRVKLETGMRAALCEPKDAEFVMIRTVYDTDETVEYCQAWERIFENQIKAVMVPTAEQCRTIKFKGDDIREAWCDDGVWMMYSLSMNICCIIVPVGFCLLSPENLDETCQEDDEKQASRLWSAREFFKERGEEYRRRHQMERDLWRCQKLAESYCRLYKEQMGLIMDVLYEPWAKKRDLGQLSWFDDHGRVKYVEESKNYPGCLEFMDEVIPYHAEILEEMRERVERLIGKY